MSRRTDPVVDADEAGGAGTLSLLEERRGRREELESRVRGVEEKVTLSWTNHIVPLGLNPS